MGSFALGLVAASLATISWGVQLPLAKDAFTVVDPFIITSLRYSAAALCLIPILVWREGWAAMSYRGATGTAAALGVVGMCGSPMLVFWGMSWSHAEHAVLIVTTQPAIAVLAYWLLRGRRPQGFTLACIAMAFIGVILVVTQGRFIELRSPQQLLGDLIILGGAACWVIYTIGMARLSGWSIWRITVLTMIPGAVASSAISFVLLMLGYIPAPALAGFVSVAWELAYLTFVGVILGMLAWNYGTRRIGALNATLLINGMPISTFAYRAVQGKQFLAIELFGAGLVVVALIANNLYTRAHHAQQSAA